MNKPTVLFVGDAKFYMVGEEEVASVYGLNHPRLGMGFIDTSVVIKKHPNGSFETLNTLYEPFKKDPDDSTD